MLFFFLNYNLWLGLIKFSALDLTIFYLSFKRSGQGKIITRQNKLLSPGIDPGLASDNHWSFFFIMHHLAEELIRGDRMDLSNSLRFDKVIINAVGSKDYNPALPNVYKYNRVNKKIAGDLIGYVDDLCTIGLTLEEAW